VSARAKQPKSEQWVVDFRRGAAVDAIMADATMTDHEKLIATVRAHADHPIAGQRVSHADLMAAAHLLGEAAEKERAAGNLFRASEINHLVLDTFKAAIRVEDIVPEAVPS